MADLVLRGLDDELVRRVRAQAAIEGQTVKVWFGTVVGQHLGKGSAPKLQANSASKAAKSAIRSLPVESDGLPSGKSIASAAITYSKGREDIAGRPKRTATETKNIDTCPYHRGEALVQSKKKTYRAECPVCHADYPKRDDCFYEVIE